MNLAPDLPPPVREARSFAAREVQVKFNTESGENTNNPRGGKGGGRSYFPFSPLHLRSPMSWAAASEEEWGDS